MKEFRFEIVRRPNDRFAWLFVGTDGRERRVLGRSARDYRSRSRVTRAIDRMRYAPVVDLSGADPEPFPLPTTSFRIVSGVLPLRVEEFSSEDDSPDLTTAQAPAPVAVAKPKPAAKRAKSRKPKPRRSSRARDAT